MILDSTFFKKKLNQSFNLTALDTGQTLETQLILNEVTDKQSNGDYESFSVTFKGPAKQPLEQKTYQFSDKNEKFEVFIVPIEVNAESCFYEATFNLLKHTGKT